ncbi:hypothetical protein [Candidatus Stoquefichus sp. SB1]|uniref:hypothetical protein n=1 Tax=Candidatus Stoquefichus sp. SB1 TaxID=1658109 RepID=UPI00067ECADB|nr:hypothetical protein [Candidatus Stoquefichus sp. SB1]
MISRISDIWLEELGKTTIPGIPNYITTIKRIPEFFNEENLLMCMILAFNFGELRGRECERDLIKRNASACFYNMRSYADAHNGELPNSQEDLKKWVHHHD